MTLPTYYYYISLFTNPIMQLMAIILRIPSKIKDKCEMMKIFTQQRQESLYPLYDCGMHPAATAHSFDLVG